MSIKVIQYEEAHSVQPALKYRRNFILQMKDELQQLAGQFDDKDIKVTIRIEATDVED